MDMVCLRNICTNTLHKGDDDDDDDDDNNNNNNNNNNNSSKDLLGEQLHEYWKILHCFVETVLTTSGTLL